MSNKPARDESGAAPTGHDVPGGGEERPAEPAQNASESNPAIASEGPLSEGAPRLPSDEQPTVISGRAAVSADGPFAWAPPRELGPRLVGQTLGHFQLNAFVGGGGMGAVFRAHDLSLDRTVAVKVLSPQQLGDSLKRFRNEAQSAARLDHPNIARVYYVGEDAGWNYIVFEYIKGINVRDLVARDGPLSLADAVIYTIQVADALDHAFRRNVIHRDIKPSNILITSEGEAKLVDMGLARLHRVDTAREDLTESGITLGTFDYISPEQARDPRNTDVRSDLYSLGCTLYYMLTGRPPFPEGTVLQKLLSHSSDPPPDPRQFRPELPRGLILVLSRMLAKRPEQRYQEPRQLIAALAAVAERHAIPLAPFTRAHWTTASLPRGPAMPRWVPWSVAAAVLLLAALGMELFTPPESPAAPLPPILSARHEESTRGAPSAPEDAQTRPFGDTEPASGGPVESSSAGRNTTPTIPSSEAAAPTLGGGAERKDEPEPRDEEPAPASQVPRPVETPGRLTKPGSASAPRSRPAVVPSSTRRVVTRSSVSPTARPPVQQLRAILQELKDHVEIEEIVLDLDGVIDLPVLQGDWILERGRAVTLRAAPERRVTLRVRPMRSEAVAGDHPAMLPLGEGRWSFESVHWRFELPEDIPERRGWSLFGLTATSEVEFQHATITMVNHDARGNVGHPGVSVFRLGAAQSGLMPVLEETPPIEGGGPQIWLESCFVRGEGSLLSVVEAQPLLCYWKHGVLAVTGRLVDIAGATRDMEWQQGRIEFSMEEVLLFAGEGLLRSRQSDMQPFLPEIAVSCKRCIVATEASEPSVAVIEQRGVDLDNWRAPQIAGQQNRYRGTDVLLRVYPRTGAGEATEYSLSELRLQPMPWYQEVDAGPLARFPWRFDARPRSAWKMAEFLRADAQRRLLEVQGWDIELLHEFPEAAPVDETSVGWKEPKLRTP